MQHMLCPGYVNCILNINDTSISFDTYVCKIYTYIDIYFKGQ